MERIMTTNDDDRRAAEPAMRDEFALIALAA